jgi:hypothetical protein
LISKTDSQTVRNDWLAGFWASLITIKPQLYYLFWPVLLFWCFQTRRWAAIGGAISGVLVGALVTMTFNPVVIQQYVGAIIGNPPSAWATPTIGGYLRLIFGLEKFWLQFLSPILGVLGVTALWIWRTLKKTEAAWNWLQDSPALLFAAVLTAAYAWTYDQVILLPTMIMILAAASQSSRRGYLWALLAALTAINFMDLILHRWLDEFWFGWLAPAYLLWFVVSYRLTLQNQQAPARTAAGSALL